MLSALAQVRALHPSAGADSQRVSTLIAYRRDPRLAFNDYAAGDGPALFAQACAMGLEGIVSKRRSSPYRSGRSLHWLKAKNPECPAARREAFEDWGRNSRW